MQYWAYLHNNGNVIVKSWYEGNNYIEEAEHSPFVFGLLYAPFEAKDNKEATEIANKKLIRAKREMEKDG